MRKAFCQLLRFPDVSKLTILKLREMDVELAPAGDGGIVPVGPFGYVTPGTSEFVWPPCRLEEFDRRFVG